MSVLVGPVSARSASPGLLHPGAPRCARRPLRSLHRPTLQVVYLGVFTVYFGYSDPIQIQPFLPFKIRIRRKHPDPQHWFLKRGLRLQTRVHIAYMLNVKCMIHIV